MNVLALVTQSSLSVNGLYSQVFKSENIIKKGENCIFKKFVGSESLTERSDNTIKETYFKSTYNCLSLSFQLEMKQDEG